MKSRKSSYAFWWLILIAILVFLFFGVYFSVSPKGGNLPSSFLVARENASQISQKIVDLTTATNQQIDLAHASDSKNDVEQALIFIKNAHDSNNEAYAQASALAVYLQQMAASMSNISSRSKQQLAYEAVAIELSLVSEFIVYTQKLNSFLDTLERALVTDSFAERRSSDDYLRVVNEQAEKINKLNDEFQSKLSEFDRQS